MKITPATTTERQISTSVKSGAGQSDVLAVLRLNLSAIREAGIDPTKALTGQLC